MSCPSVLVVGESWIKHTIHMKGFDQFHSTEYEEGAGIFLDGLIASGFAVDYIRGHEVSARFPTTAAELDAYDVVVISDIGSNSFLLTDEVFLRSQRTVNRLALVADYVERGGGLLMIGGFLSFTGIDGKARYGSSPIASVLPVELLPYDDRVEAPEGVAVTVAAPEHPTVTDAPGTWPDLLGYNRVITKPSAVEVASVGPDPLIAVAEVGAGRSAVFTSDVAPHWAPPEFMGWEHYHRLWAGIVGWTAGRGAGSHDRVDTVETVAALP